MKPPNYRVTGNRFKGQLRLDHSAVENVLR
jgi:hypothetical protein